MGRVRSFLRLLILIMFLVALVTLYHESVYQEEMSDSTTNNIHKDKS